ARLIAALWAAALRLQALGWRKRLAGVERIGALRDAGVGIIAVFWHGKYVPLFALLRAPGAVVFTSRSFRGDVISALCRRLGFRAVELPPEGGEAALAAMRRALEQARAGAIAVDGPQGPYHEVKRGALELASQLGYVLLPVSAAARRARVAASRWDRMEFPRPFTTVRLEVGEPIAVPRELDEAALQAWSERVREALEAIDARVADFDAPLTRRS
ncbi:MAG: DUF374 domain-containing protein, partial [Burkholderiales bacterium]|nr:DUF374 domain-containing protein [Burkholderiales bacterium]